MKKKENALLKFLSYFSYKTDNKPKEFYIPEPEKLENNNKNNDSQENMNIKSPSKIPKDIDVNIDFIDKSFNSKVNKDIVIRKFIINGKYRAFIAFLSGMIDPVIINNSILRPLLNSTKLINEDNICHLDYVLSEIIETNKVIKVMDKDTALYEILSGNTILHIDGCDYFISSETKGFDKRSIERPQIEGALAGSQEAFNETLSTNITLIRKNIKNKDLTSEYIKIGSRTQILCAIMYINGLTNPAIIDEVKRRVSSIKADYIMGGGMLEQFIEDNTLSLFPTVLSTERPDKTVANILEGRVAILVDGIPFASIVPVTFASFMHTTDDSFMRWQYGTFIRLIRFAALLIALLLPSLYVAITNFHQEMIPTELLIAIAQAKENVPFPTLVEVMLMEISFELIREAGIRIPGMIGNTLGIIGALILGQAAVQANIVSPILIIVVAVTGLSNFSIPSYTFGFSIRILRFVFIFAGSLLGFYGITIGWIILSAIIFHKKSFGINYFAPVTPVTTMEKDFLIKHPIWRREKRPDYLNPLDITRQPEISRDWIQQEPKYSHERKNKND
jgi:spore germination protein KA